MRTLEKQERLNKVFIDPKLASAQGLLTMTSAQWKMPTINSPGHTRT